MNSELGSGRSLAAILGDMKNELLEFAQTRMELFKTELREKLGALKSAAPAVVIGAVLLLTAFLLLSLALVALVAAGFSEGPYRWFFGFLIVGLLWCAGGGMAVYAAKRRVSRQSMVPKKTMSVLNGDKVWLHKEKREAL